MLNERVVSNVSDETKYSLLSYWNPFLEITCPKLPVPTNGIHLDKACDGANSECTSSCRLDCKSGYKVAGNFAVSCHGSGKWDQQQGSCVGKYFFHLFYFEFYEILTQL